MSRKSFMDENVAGSSGIANRLLLSVADRQGELNHVARVLHEQIGQVLTAVGLHLDLLRQDFAPAAPAIADRTREIQQLLEQAIDDVRQLSYRLNPDVVQRSGLRYSLNALIGKYRESHKATIRFLMDSSVRVPLPVGQAIYQIVHHALDNAVQHSRSDLIEVVLQAPREVRLEIRDNGVGFNYSQTIEQPRGLGLLWIRYWASAAGLSLRLDSSSGTGTAVRVVHDPMAENTPAGYTPAL